MRGGCASVSSSAGAASASVNGGNGGRRIGRRAGSVGYRRPGRRGSTRAAGAETTDVAVGVHSRVFEKDSRPIILFDGACNMCNAGVNFILDFDSGARLRMSALQSETGRGLLEHSGRRPDDISSIVLVEESGHHIKSDAILKIGQLLNMPFPIVCSLFLTAPAVLRDGAYDVVADNRYNVFGRARECRLWDDRYADRFV